MATSIYFVRSVGEAWALIVADWMRYLPDTDAAFALTISSTAPNLTIKAAKTGGVDPFEHIYRIVEMSVGQTVGPSGYLTSPGWRTNPPLMPSVYGSRTVLTDWRATMVPFKMVTWPAAMGVVVGTVQQSTLDYEPAMWRTSIDLAVINKSGMIGVELCALGVRNAGYAGTALSPNLPSDCILAGPGSVSLQGGGSSSIDLAPVTEALRDIGRRDTTLSINNGDTLVHSYGSEIEE